MKEPFIQQYVVNFTGRFEGIEELGHFGDTALQLIHDEAIPESLKKRIRPETPLKLNESPTLFHANPKEHDATGKNWLFSCIEWDLGGTTLLSQKERKRLFQETRGGYLWLTLGLKKRNSLLYMRRKKVEEEDKKIEDTRLQVGRVLVHKLIAWLAFGDNDEEVTMHVCQNKKCITPRHLIYGTQKLNVQHSWFTRKASLPNEAYSEVENIKGARDLKMLYLVEGPLSNGKARE